MKHLIALGTAALLATGTVHAEELFVNIHSGSAMAQGAGLVLAGQALEQKASVRVLLCDKAGDIAVVGAAIVAMASVSIGVSVDDVALPSTLPSASVAQPSR